MNTKAKYYLFIMFIIFNIIVGFTLCYCALLLLERWSLDYQAATLLSKEFFLHLHWIHFFACFNDVWRVESYSFYEMPDLATGTPQWGQIFHKFNFWSLKLYPEKAITLDNCFDTTKGRPIFKIVCSLVHNVCISFVWLCC